MVCNSFAMTRKYEQKLRAEKQEETRRRIVEAAVELHGTLGPGLTSLSAVAERAQVQRNTLYRHFPDERTLLFACSAHYSDLHPFPATETWADIDDPIERARTALRTMYSYYDEVESMMSLVLRDAETNDNVAEVGAAWAAGLPDVRDSLVSVWPRPARRKQLVALVELALSFRTWQTLVRRNGLSTKVAADLMTELLEGRSAR